MRILITGASGQLGTELVKALQTVHTVSGSLPKIYADAEVDAVTHSMLDIADRQGASIAAAADGTVCFAGPCGTYGQLVKVDHGNGFVTYYAHCSALLVSVGDWVAQGEPVAEMGSTGRSTGPHCHFEIRWLGTPLDPLACLG